MNPDAPRTPQEELEIRVTALLMGQLSPEEAAEIEAQIAADPELAALHSRLSHAANLLRESRALTEPSVGAPPLQLSKERREKLLATFRGIKPLPAPSPPPTTVQSPPRPTSRERKWVVPIALAASIAVLIGGGVVYLGRDQVSAVREESQTFSGKSVSYAPSNARYRFAESDQPSAPAEKAVAEDYAVAVRSNAAGLSEETKARAYHWSSQPGTVRTFPGEQPASGYKLYSSDNIGKPASTAGEPVASTTRSDQEMPVTRGTVTRAAGDTAAAKGIYLPATDASNKGGPSDIAERGFQTSPPPPAPISSPVQALAATRDELRAVNAPAGPAPQGKAEQPLPTENKIIAGGSGLATDASKDEVALAKLLATANISAEAESDASKTAAAQANDRLLGSRPITAGNRSGQLAASPNAIDALLFEAIEVNGTAPGKEAAKGDELKDSPRATAATREEQTEAYIKAPVPDGGAEIARSKRVPSEVTTTWEVPYRRGIAGKAVPPNKNEQALRESSKELAAGETKSENTFWDFQDADGTVRSRSGRESTVGADRPVIVSGGASGALGMLGDADTDLSLSFQGGEKFEPPQIPQTFGNAARYGLSAFPMTPTTPGAAVDRFDASNFWYDTSGDSEQAITGLSLSPPLPTAGKIQLDAAARAAFAASTAPAEPIQNAQAEGTKSPASALAPAQPEFVTALTAVRKAEEQTGAGDSQGALETYRNAATTLAKVKEQWPKWQPELVEQRLKRANEAITQIEAKIAQKAAETEPPAPAKAVQSAPVPQPEISTKENAFSTFSLNVTDVSFQLAAASLEKSTMPEPATVRSEEFINALNYRDPEPAAGSRLAFASERARYPFAHNRDLLRLSVKTAAAGREPGRPLNLVLLLDNSGSMERADRVRILKESLRVLTQQLQPQDKLSLITFSRTPRLWADGVSGDKASEFTQRVGEIVPQGGTDLSAAMDLGYETALKHYQVGNANRVVLLTDGAANLGDVKAEALKQKVEAHRKQGVAFDCFGVGWEGYNDDLLEQLARNGDGRYGFINTPEAAATEFAGQLAGSLRVAASDVKVQVEFNPRRVLAYRQVGYAKHQLKKEQFRDNTVDAAEIGAAESGNALYVIDVNPRGEGDIATVRVRFKVPGTTDYHEHDWAVPFQAQAPAMEQASSSMRLAATAAAFSEWLAQSPFAAEVTTDRLLGMINGIPAIYGADQRPAKLESMIRQAKSISGR